MRHTDLNILFLGDSITNGEFVNEDEDFPSLVFNRLVDQEVRQDINVEILAANGWTTRLALSCEEWSDVMRWRPEIAFIQFGLNDCNRWETDGGIRRVNTMSFGYNIREMIERLRTAGCRTIYLFNTHKTTKGERYELDSFFYSGILNRVAIDESVYIIDIRKMIGFIHLMPDGIHLNRMGHIRYANIVMDVLGYDPENPDAIKNALEWTEN